MVSALISPPVRVTANFVNPANQMPNNIVLHTICLSLATGGLILRMFTRIKILRARPSPHDYFCIISWCLTMIFSGLMFESYHLGIGRHMWNEPSTWIVPALKYFTIAQYIYLLLTAAVKLTFLSFYHRVFAHVPSMRFTIIGGMVFVAVSHIVMVFLTVFSCSPISGHWDVFDTTKKCWNNLILPYASGALSSSTDLFVLLLPIHSLWKLKMNMGSRIRIIGVFGIGGLYVKYLPIIMSRAGKTNEKRACVASLIRLGMTHILVDGEDETWNISHLAIWAVLECNIGIWCSCLMFLPKFIEFSCPQGIMSGITRIWSGKSSNRSKGNRNGSKDSTDPVPLSEKAKLHVSRQESFSFVKSHAVSQGARLSGNREDVHNFV
ncbi:unnamed protein product [Penicillium glandicola]